MHQLEDDEDEDDEDSFLHHSTDELEEDEEEDEDSGLHHMIGELEEDSFLHSTLHSSFFLQQGFSFLQHKILQLLLSSSPISPACVIKLIEPIAMITSSSSSTTWMDVRLTRVRTPSTWPSSSLPSFTLTLQLINFRKMLWNVSLQTFLRSVLQQFLSVATETDLTLFKGK